MSSAVRFSHRFYPSDLTDLSWKHLQACIPRAKRLGRHRTTDLRSIWNALLYLNRTGCTWRALPRDFPPWQTVYRYFRKWSNEGFFERLHEKLVERVRVKLGRSKSASALAVDSQSVRSPLGQNRGYDGFKKIRGRKRHILVDTLGLIRALHIDAADLQDRREALHLIQSYASTRSHRAHLEAIYADRAYTGCFCDQAYVYFGIWPTITSAKPGGHGNKFLNHNLKPVRWIVERTFAWFNHFRRLSKDYERKTSHSKSMIHLAMTQIMLKKLYVELA